MAELLGMYISNEVRNAFTNYARFVLLYAALDSVFSTVRSGSNEVFLKTSFQYAKSGLRKKLISYFDAAELLNFDGKAQKKKENWMDLVQKKKEKLLKIFEEAKAECCQDTKVGIIGGNDHNNVYIDHQTNTNYPLFAPVTPPQKYVNIFAEGALTLPSVDNYLHTPRIYEVPQQCPDCMQKMAERDYWKLQYEELLKGISSPQNEQNQTLPVPPILNSGFPAENEDVSNDTLGPLLGLNAAFSDPNNRFNQLIAPMIQQQQPMMSAINNNCFISGLNVQNINNYSV